LTTILLAFNEDHPALFGNLQKFDPDHHFFVVEFLFHAMSSIATSLWDSIFVPGPTPVLIKAMNLSFFALFALLVPLTYVTKNIHVFFLTLLTVGLWIAMQWFPIPLKTFTDTSRFLIELEKAKQTQIQESHEQILDDKKSN